MDVYPASALDVMPRGTSFTVGLVFRTPARGPIDIEQLRAALFKAVSEKVPRAAARIAGNRKRYEFHIPRDLNNHSQPVGFTSAIHVNQPAPKNALPNLDGFDDQESRPIVLANDDGAASLFRGPDCPTTLAAILNHDIPAINAHVTVYSDLVLVGLTVQHMLVDAEGTAMVLRAWAAATRAKLDSIPASPVDFSPFSDPSALIAAAEKEGQVDDPWTQIDTSMRFLGFFSAVVVIIQYIWSMIFAGTQQNVVLRLPKSWVAEQKAIANKEAAKDGQDIQVSTNDIIVAFMAKFAYAHRRDAQLQNYHSVINLREFIPSILPSTTPYINNALSHYAPPAIPANQLASAPLAWIAIRLRHALNAYRAGPRLARVAYYFKHTAAGRLYLPASPGQGFSFASSWLQSRLDTIEFVFHSSGGATIARPIHVFGEMYGGAKDLGQVIFGDEKAYWATWKANKADLAKNVAILKHRGELFSGPW